MGEKNCKKYCQIEQRKALIYKNTYIHYKTLIIHVKNIHSLMYEYYIRSHQTEVAGNRTEKNKQNNTSKTLMLTNFNQISKCIRLK